jgi:hypothetical protein
MLVTILFGNFLSFCLLSKNKNKKNLNILPVVLYGYKTWSVTSEEEQQGDEKNIWNKETRNDRELHNGEIHKLHSAPSLGRMANEMGRVCCMNGELVGKPDGKRSLGEPNAWIDLAQCRDQWKVPVNKVVNLRVS